MQATRETGLSKQRDKEMHRACRNPSGRHDIGRFPCCSASTYLSLDTPSTSRLEIVSILCLRIRDLILLGALG